MAKELAKQNVAAMMTALADCLVLAAKCPSDEMAVDPGAADIQCPRPNWVHGCDR